MNTNPTYGILPPPMVNNDLFSNFALTPAIHDLPYHDNFYFTQDPSGGSEHISNSINGTNSSGTLILVDQDSRISPASSTTHIEEQESQEQVQLNLLNVEEVWLPFNGAMNSRTGVPKCGAGN
ncbi:hypothetical protein FRX31_025757 [Thalictrum thalictroides]|uniref:Uncharacterized protein n=1 Tax=Thalictrum thalictroides TaxID=46969 RepID=A0A7J6VHS4_THATH|nr:hypothetical protein FRX31_025757 [Thalictrum thalictroides]